MRGLLEEHRNNKGSFPLVGGHRGCSCQYQENSLRAMEEGIKRGASYLEIDIQLTKDKIPVVFHDINVKEKTGLEGLVQEHTYQELYDRYGIPTLREAMQWGKRNQAWFALELKSLAYRTQESNLALMPLLDGIVREEGMLERVEAFGLDYQVLKRLKNIDPAFEIGLIVPFVPADPVSLMQEMQAMVYLSYVYNITRPMLGQLQDHGYYVSGAILRDPELIQYAITMHVDMFEHDNPEQFSGREG